MICPQRIIHRYVLAVFFLLISVGLLFYHLHLQIMKSVHFKNALPQLLKVNGTVRKRYGYLQRIDLNAPVNGSYRCLIKKRPFPICIHDIKKDIYVSKAILTGGAWERNHLQLIRHLLQSDPTYGFIDLGANIGQFTLQMAALGRNVVAVEPVVENFMRLAKSAQLGNVTDRIILIQNAISDERGRVALRSFGSNQGAYQVKKNVGDCGGQCVDGTIQAIILDDLLEVIPFKKAIMKMDVEVSEHRIMANTKLFNVIDVPYILMEWQGMKSIWKRKRGDKDFRLLLRMLDFLQGNGYQPYNPGLFHVGQKLSYENAKKWPHDILFYCEKCK